MKKRNVVYCLYGLTHSCNVIETHVVASTKLQLGVANSWRVKASLQLVIFMNRRRVFPRSFPSVEIIVTRLVALTRLVLVFACNWHRSTVLCRRLAVIVTGSSRNFSRNRSLRPGAIVGKRVVKTMGLNIFGIGCIHSTAGN